MSSSPGHSGNSSGATEETRTCMETCWARILSGKPTWTIDGQHRDISGTGTSLLTWPRSRLTPHLHVSVVVRLSKILLSFRDSGHA
ncbi:hypothetical protein CGCF415_v012634 [Colletotrichum fructicola]|nr:hypothetical protein CGCF415_v012634 [Colletotrichum fructicola]KAF4931145.1 hypothetical protein CGCF245_v011329 [Colletotrichum fructicola]